MVKKINDIFSVIFMDKSATLHYINLRCNASKLKTTCCQKWEFGHICMFKKQGNNNILHLEIINEIGRKTSVLITSTVRTKDLLYYSLTLLSGSLLASVSQFPFSKPIFTLKVFALGALLSGLYRGRRYINSEIRYDSWDERMIISYHWSRI